MTRAHTIPLIHKFLKVLASLAAFKLIKMYIAFFVQPCLEFGTLLGTRTEQNEMKWHKVMTLKDTRKPYHTILAALNSCVYIYLVEIVVVGDVFSYLSPLAVAICDCTKEFTTTRS